MRIAVAVFTTLILFIASLFFVYPFVFNGISGMFENRDLGLVVGLLVCVAVTVPLIWIGIAVGVGAAYLGAVLENKANAKARAKRRTIR